MKLRVGVAEVTDLNFPSRKRSITKDLLLYKPRNFTPSTSMSIAKTVLCLVFVRMVPTHSEPSILEMACAKAKILVYS